MASQPAQQKPNSKRTTNQTPRHQQKGANWQLNWELVDELDPKDILQERIGGHSRSKRAAHIASRTKAVQNKAVAEATELQIDSSSGGNKRKYALTEIKANLANKCLYVRRSLPPMGGGTSTQPPLTGGNAHPPPPHPSPKPLPKGKHNLCTIWRAGDYEDKQANKTTTAPPAPTKTTALLGMWLETAEVRERGMGPGD
jgi:hypothetical protein